MFITNVRPSKEKVTGKSDAAEVAEAAAIATTARHVMGAHRLFGIRRQRRSSSLHDRCRLKPGQHALDEQACGVRMLYRLEPAQVTRRNRVTQGHRIAHVMASARNELSYGEKGSTYTSHCESKINRSARRFSLHCLSMQNECRGCEADKVPIGA